MSYFNSKLVDYSFEEAIEKIAEELKKEGFGVLTEIDVKEIFKKRLDVDFRKYKIFGACNPSFAYEALKIEPHIGALLPCNVIIQENEKGKVDIAIVNPIESMQNVANPNMGSLADEVSNRLSRVLQNL